MPLPTSLVLRLHDKAQPGIVALVLDAAEASPAALEAHAAGLAHTHAIERLVGAGGERLGQHRIQVLGPPSDPPLACELVKGVLGKAVLLPQGREGSPSLLRVCPGD